MFEWWIYPIIAVVGLVAGMLGGMLGVGGSVVMIPMLALLFGQDLIEGFNQHVYQAAAMIVNVFVAVPALRKHYKAGAVVSRAMLFMLPTALVLIFVGVWTSNLPVFSAQNGGGGPVLLGRVMAVFLLYVIGLNLYRFVRPLAEPTDGPPYPGVTPARSGFVGGTMGYVAGLLGIGGGAVAVPMQQVVLRLPLRNCIANSSAVMAVTAGFGAMYKNATLSTHGLQWQTSLLLAAMLIPTAIVGGHLGAHFTHVFPLRFVRFAFIALMMAAAWRMAGI